MWILLVPLSVLIFSVLGRSRIGYVSAWLISGIINMALSVGAYFLLSNSASLSLEVLIVASIGFSISLAGPIALWIYQFVRTRC